ncbi:response regulator [Rhodohalobacter sp. SW132]|uniref:response regulator n=1 Tax=Rhodohalobacter sp. SW132 TaxID=2293433 RepID=UPI000E242D77|nr:response regulator [Rhodohalobacter sp. SW132]REL29136.1 response regulator [Rhodohalobacter sp. SW132]
MSLPVLIVDDDAGVLFLHELMVRESGFSEDILTFNGARKALDYLEKQKDKISAGIIFLDINMPGMDGWKFLELLDESGQFERVFVVMVSSSVNRSDRDKAKSFPHVIDYIEKPLDFEACEKVKKLEAISNFFEDGIS